MACVRARRALVCSLLPLCARLPSMKRVPRQRVGAERCKGSTSYSPTALAAYRDASFLLHPSRWTRPPGAAGLTSVIATFENP